MDGQEETKIPCSFIDIEGKTGMKSSSLFNLFIGIESSSNKCQFQQMKGVNAVLIIKGMMSSKGLMSCIFSCSSNHSHPSYLQGHPLCAVAVSIIYFIESL